MVGKNCYKIITNQKMYKNFYYNIEIMGMQDERLQNAKIITTR